MKINVIIQIFLTSIVTHWASYSHDTTYLRDYATQKALSNYIQQDYGKDFSIWAIKLQDGSLMLPDSIASLPIYTHQFEVIRQREPGSCVSRSVANALAIRDVLKQGLELNSTTVREESLKYEHLHIRTGMTTHVAMELAHRYGMKNAFSLNILFRDSTNQDSLNKSPFTVIDSCLWGEIAFCNETKIIEKINQLIRSKETIEVHFFCYLACKRGHSVVISVIKAKGMPTRIIYMDSNNIPLTDTCQATAYMKYIYWQSIA